MNYKKTAAAWGEKGLSPLQKMTLLYLTFRENKDGRAFPAIDTIEDDTGISRKVIIAAIDALEAKNLVKTSKRWGKPALYETFPSSVENDTTSENATSVENGVSSSGENDTTPLYTNYLKTSNKAEKAAAAVLYKEVEFTKIRNSAAALIATIPAFNSLLGNDSRIAAMLMPTRRNNTENANSLLNQAADHAVGKHSSQQTRKSNNGNAVKINQAPVDSDDAGERKFRERAERNRAAIHAAAKCG